MTNEPMSWSELHELGIDKTDTPPEVFAQICACADYRSLDCCDDCIEAEYCVGTCDIPGSYAADIQDEMEREWLTSHISDILNSIKPAIQNRFEVLK